MKCKHLLCFSTSANQILLILFLNVESTLGAVGENAFGPNYDALAEQCMTCLRNPDLLLFLCFLRRLFFAEHMFHAVVF